MVDDDGFYFPRSSVCKGPCKKRLSHKDPKTGIIVWDAHYHTPTGRYCFDCFALKVDKKANIPYVPAKRIEKKNAPNKNER